MSFATRMADKAGVIGAVIGSFGCAACFPAAASIGAALGLGFLGQWEGLLVRILIPLFALVALLANLAGWFSHRQWHRTLIGSMGPVLALVGAFGLMGFFGLSGGFLPANVARGVFYAGLVIMLMAALWDLVSPADRHCRPSGIRMSAQKG